MSIGENIKKQRIENGITQFELAMKLGITQSMLCQIERGTKAVSLPLGRDIAECLGCSIDNLIGEN